MTIKNKKESSRNTTSASTSASSSSVSENATKVSKKVVSSSEVCRSSSGVQIQDISENASTSGEVVTYKLDNSNNINLASTSSGLETVTTFNKSKSGSHIAQTVAYPPVEQTSSHYVQYISDADASTSSHTVHSSSIQNLSMLNSSKSTSEAIGKGSVLNTTYTITEPKEDVIYSNRKDGDSAWNGKFVYEKPLVIKPNKNEEVIQMSSSSASAKSSSMAKSSSSSYVIEIVDGKERIIDSKHHESASADSSNYEEHASSKSGTNIPTESHVVQKGSDSRTAYDTANPMLTQPQTHSSEFRNEMHSVDGKTTSSSHAISDGKTLSSDKNIQHITDKTTSTNLSDIRKSQTSSDTSKFFGTSSSDVKSSSKVVRDKLSSDQITSQDFITSEAATTSTSKNVSDTSNFYGKSNVETTDTVKETPRHDTHWDGTFTVENRHDNKKKAHTTDSRNFFDNSASNKHSTKTTTIIYDSKGNIIRQSTDNANKSQPSDSTKFYDNIRDSQSITETTTVYDSSGKIISETTDRSRRTQPSTGKIVRETIDKPQTTSTDSKKYGNQYTTETTTVYDSKGNIIQEPVEHIRRTQTTDSQDFYGHNSGITDNTVVKNVYDTKSTQNTIGTTGKIMKQSVIYDSDGKVINDKTDIVFSNDRNYGKTGWNGKFTYEQPQTTPKKPADVTTIKKDDKYSKSEPKGPQQPEDSSKSSKDKESGLKRPEDSSRYPQGAKGPGSKHPRDDQPGRIIPSTSITTDSMTTTAENFETINKFSSTDIKTNVYQDSTNFVDNYTIIESGTGKQIIPDSKTPKGPVFHSPKGPLTQENVVVSTDNRTTSTDFETVNTLSSSTSDVKVFKDSKTFVDNQEVIETYIITDDGISRRIGDKPTDKLVPRHPDGSPLSTTIRNYETVNNSSITDVKNFVFEDNKTTVEFSTTDVDFKGPKGPKDLRPHQKHPKDVDSTDFISTESYEISKNFSSTDIKKTAFEDIRSETIVDQKTITDIRDVTDFADIVKQTDVVDRSVTKTFVDESTVVDIKTTVRIIFIYLFNWIWVIILFVVAE